MNKLSQGQRSSDFGFSFFLTTSNSRNTLSCKYCVTSNWIPSNILSYLWSRIDSLVRAHPIDLEMYWTSLDNKVNSVWHGTGSGKRLFNYYLKSTGKIYPCLFKLIVSYPPTKTYLQVPGDMFSTWKKKRAVSQKIIPILYKKNIFLGT